MPSKPKPAAPVAPPLPRSDLLVVYRDPRALAPYARNARTHSAEQIQQIQASIREFGFCNPILLKDDDRTIGAGHARVQAAIAEELDRVPTITLPGLTETQWRGYVIADNRLSETGSGWNEALLKLEFGELGELGFDLSLTGFTLDEIGALDLPAGSAQSGAGSLAEQFMIAPFSVLNAREGWWQDRKRAWLALGIQSELGRGDTAVNSPHEGHGMADGLVAVRAKEKAAAASPGGSLMPAADYSDGERGDGAGRPRHKANAIPGGGDAPRSRAERNGATPGGGGKTAIYRKGPGFRYDNA